MFSGEDAEKKVSVLSGGEKARLALACMLTRPANLLVLDEPTHHLDIISKNILKEAIIKYDGTLLVVSHDRSFLDGLTSKTYEFRDQKIHEHLGDVNEFLSKRAMDSFREVEMRTKKKAVVVEQKPQQLNREEEKKQKRVIQNAERKIARLEEQIEAIELKMADPAFYEQSDSDQILAEYKSLKNQLSDQMEKWEKAVELLG
jgi:ATP-binding cassette subfamily F protein 3